MKLSRLIIESRAIIAKWGRQARQDWYEASSTWYWTRQDIAEGALESGNDVLAGEDVAFRQFGGRRTVAEDFRLPQFGINHPDQRDAGLPVVVQFFLQLLGRVAG